MPQVVQSADVIFIAVKPQYVSVVLREVAPHLEDRHTIVSIAAGITLQSLKVRWPGLMVAALPAAAVLLPAAAACCMPQLDGGDEDAIGSVRHVLTSRCTALRPFLVCRRQRGRVCGWCG